MVVQQSSESWARLVQLTSSPPAPPPTTPWSLVRTGAFQEATILHLISSLFHTVLVLCSSTSAAGKEAFDVFPCQRGSDRGTMITDQLMRWPLLTWVLAGTLGRRHEYSRAVSEEEVATGVTLEGKPRALLKGEEKSASVVSRMAARHPRITAKRITRPAMCRVDFICIRVYQKPLEHLKEDIKCQGSTVFSPLPNSPLWCIYPEALHCR